MMMIALPAEAGPKNGRALLLSVLAALLLVIGFAAPAFAQTFPQLTGRVVDQANLLRPDQLTDLTSKLTALDAQSGRQFVVVTVKSLEGHPIEDYGYRLGRAWGIGQKGKDDGVLMLVAPNEKQVRIETGYGARVFLTDAVSSIIIRNSILPKFRQGDMGGGIIAGADQIITQMSLPPDEAQRRMAGMTAQAKQQSNQSNILPMIFWVIIFFAVIASLSRRSTGRRYGGAGPVVLWGPGWGGGSGSGWGGGGFGGGGGGGFSGGGGSFGGGGASGGW